MPFHHFASNVFKPSSDSRRRTNVLNCWRLGWMSPSSHERTKAVAIPIFAATWPGVRFFSIRLARIKSPTVFMLADNGLACCCFLSFGAYFTRIRRCAIPSRATLLQGEGENLCATGLVLMPSGLAVEVREYFIPNFSNWKVLADDHPAAFESAFARLKKDLEAETKLRS